MRIGLGLEDPRGQEHNYVLGFALGLKTPGLHLGLALEGSGLDYIHVKVCRFSFACFSTLFDSVLIIHEDLLVPGYLLSYHLSFI